MISKKDFVFFIFPLSLSVIDSDKGFLFIKSICFLRVRAHVCACNILSLLKECSLYARAKSNIYLLNKKNFIKSGIFVKKSVPYMLKVYFFMLNSL